MSEAAQLFQAYGVPGIAAIVFVKRMGVPVPAMPFLLLAGAHGTQDPGFAWAAGLAACAAAVVADALWFDAGRRFGRRVLSLMCRISIAPDVCIRRSELEFSRRGGAAVLFAKFIPGVAGLAPPLAGALRMPRGRFTGLNLAGTVLWVGTGLAGGLLLHRQVEHVVLLLRELASVTMPALALVAGAYVLWLLAWRAMLGREALRVPRVEPGQVAEGMARGESFVFVDVRGPATGGGQRIPGAIDASETLRQQLARIDPRVPLVIYCDCPGDLAAANVAATLRRRGWRAHVLAGGFPAWLAHDLPVESGPEYSRPVQSACRR